jgi:hypothetical protein
MIFRATREWKSFLNIEDEIILNKFLEEIAQYRGAYRNADDVKIAQLWCAVLQLKKENQELKNKLKILDEIFLIIAKNYQKDINLLKSLEKF